MGMSASVQNLPSAFCRPATRKLHPGAAAWQTAGRGKMGRHVTERYCGYATHRVSRCARARPAHLTVRPVQTLPGGSGSSPMSSSSSCDGHP